MILLKLKTKSEKSKISGCPSIEMYVYNIDTLHYYSLTIPRWNIARMRQINIQKRGKGFCVIITRTLSKCKARNAGQHGGFLCLSSPLIQHSKWRIYIEYA